MKLFRGCNLFQFIDIQQRQMIEPKSFTFEIIFTHDGSIRCDGSATCGLSRQNAIVGHQIDSRKFKTSGISTTPHFEIAKKYALHIDKYPSGIVLELDLENLDLSKYEIITVAEKIKSPNKPEDEERILKRYDNLAIPLDIFRIHKI